MEFLGQSKVAREGQKADDGQEKEELLKRHFSTLSIPSLYQFKLCPLLMAVTFQSKERLQGKDGDEQGKGRNRKEMSC